MRSLLPIVSEKLDNASIFELAVDYITFLKETVGNEHDVVSLDNFTHA